MLIDISHPAPGHSVLTGDLTIDSVSEIVDAFNGQFGDNHVCTIDLSGVKHCDSAGLAVLIHWFQQAKQQDVTLHFTQLPAQLRALAEISEVKSLFEGEING